MPIEIHESGNVLHSAMQVRLATLPRRRQRRHEFYVLTCYLDFPAVRELILATSQVVRLKRVRVMFDFSELFHRRTPVEAEAAIAGMVSECAGMGIAFDAVPLKAGALMHAKAYAVVQSSGGSSSGGCVWIASGNATRRGLGFGDPNVEVSSCSARGTDLAAFLEIWRGLEDRYATTLFRPVASAREYAFKYGLLASGVYLHHWTAPLAGRLALRYNLTEEASGRAMRVLPGL